jgi:hypothetical protein
MRARRAALAGVLAVALAAPHAARAADGAWPDQARLQFAGNVGVLSPGVGWGWLGRRLELDLFLGWVPASLGGELWSTTAKVTWMPWRERLAGLTVRPLTVAAQLSYTFGDEYWVRLPSRYPAGYHPLPTALRSALALGASAGRPAFGLDEVGVYAELVALDLMLGLWLGNRDALGPEDVFSLAIGVRAAF